MAQPPLSVSLLTCTVFSMLGGSGLWFSFPSHRQEVRNQVVDVSERIKAFEDRLGQKLQSSHRRLLGLWHRADADNDGKVHINELVEVHEPHDHEDASEVEGSVLSWTKPKILIFLAVDVLILALLGICWERRHRIPYSRVHGKGTLIVAIKRAYGLVEEGAKEADIQAYCTARVGKTHFSTDCKTGSNPVWDAPDMKFPVDFDNKNQRVDVKDLILEVYDYSFLRSVSLGTLVIDIHDFAQYEKQTISKCQTLKNGHQGKIELTAKYEPLGPPAGLAKSKSH